MRRAFWYRSVIPLVFVAAASAAVTGKVDSQQQWERKGYALFMRCEFKRAAQTFEKGITAYPHSAVLHYWAGKSYARLIDLSTFSTARNARKARHSLEEAVRLDPRNEEYLRELFELYVYFPEFFNHGLDRAADLIESVRPEESREEMLTTIEMSRREHRNPEEWLRGRTLGVVSGISYLLPLP
jgi:tetratricopeptide (TPR) repeat protein